MVDVDLEDGEPVSRDGFCELYPEIVDDDIGEWKVVVIKGREEVPPNLDKLESLAVVSMGKVGEVEGDGDAMPFGLSAMDGGGRGLKRGGKGDFGWCINSEGGDDGAVPVQGSWTVPDHCKCGGHGEARGVPTVKEGGGCWIVLG